MDEADPETDRLLRALRPEPRADFVRELEVSLATRRRRAERLRVVAVGSALCAALVALTTALAVAGLLPVGLGSDDSVEAQPQCTTTVEVRRERRPVLVVDRDGAIRTEFRSVNVRKPVKRCR